MSKYFSSCDFLVRTSILRRFQNFPNFVVVFFFVEKKTYMQSGAVTPLYMLSKSFLPILKKQLITGN